MKFTPAKTSVFLPALALFTAFSWGSAAPQAFGQAGSLDPSYDLGSVPMTDTSNPPVVTTIAQQADGKVLLGGINLTTINGEAVQPVIRTNSDGTLDSSFAPPVIESYNTRTDSIITKTDPSYKPLVDVVVPQADGTILVGGSFYFINGLSGFGGLVRLNADGTYDGGFAPPRFNGTVYAIVRTSDDKYIVGGDFSISGLNTRSGLVRLDASGHLDTSFNPGAFAGTLINSVDGTNFSSVRSLAVQTDGKIVIGGVFSSINGKSRRGVARLTADGVLDNTFKPSDSFNPAASGHDSASLQDQVLAVTLQTDGKILVGGYFSSISGNDSVPANSLYRFNTDGSLDASFNVGMGTADPSVDQDRSYVNAIVVQADGKIVIGGGFKSYAGTRLFALTRLNADGTLDGGFAGNDLSDRYKRYGPDMTVQALALQSDGQLLVGGFFANYVTPMGRYLDTVETETRDLVARVRTAEAVSVKVATTQPKALTTPETTQKGMVTFTRTGDLTTALTVYVTLEGSTATPGVDFRLPKKLTPATGGLYTLTFPAGTATLPLNIRALTAPALAKTKTLLVLTLVPTDGYFISTDTAATQVKVVFKPASIPGE